MTNIKTLFTVIDPTTDTQYALERAKRIAKVSDAKIHAYLGLSPTHDSHDPEALKRVELSRNTMWLENFLKDSRSEGFDIDSEVEWNEDWRSAIGAAAARVNSDLIVKSSHRRTVTRRLMMTSSDLALLETAHCPVQLVSSEVKSDLHKVLISVDTKREDEEYLKVFDAVVDFGRTVTSTNENGELHVVYAYSDSEDFEHVTDIAKRVGVDTDFVHVTGGDPEDAIAEVAKKIDAHLVIIGLSTRSTLSNRFFGNVVDGLLNNLEHDILVVVPRDN